jgi:hypothetical protein
MLHGYGGGDEEDDVVYVVNISAAVFAYRIHSLASA